MGQIGIERVIHLQYSDGPHPYGITSLDTSLVSQQPYDIYLTLHVPRSPPNIHRGNFMLSLSLLSPTYKFLPPPTDPSPATPLSGATGTLSLSKSDILFSSRRPTLQTYTSPWRNQLPSPAAGRTSLVSRCWYYKLDRMCKSTLRRLHLKRGLED